MTGRGDVERKPPLTIYLANPRGFCAGVERAVAIVQRAIDRFGAPVYVRHEIVHNPVVVKGLEQEGAVFIDELDEAPDGRPVIFSAHGVPKSVPAEAERRGLLYVDATCPLVSKVHLEAERHYADGLHILLIGHAGHPEIVGTLGQLPEGAITLVETIEDAESLQPADSDRLAYITQTTLSIDDTADIIAALQRRFPYIAGPRKEDICYATTNRQNAVKEIAARCDALLVVGAGNSSNSVRLVETATRAGCPQAYLIGGQQDIDWPGLAGVTTLGLTAGASAPDFVVQEVIDACRERFDVTLEVGAAPDEDVHFKLPRILNDRAA